MKSKALPKGRLSESTGDSQGRIGRGRESRSTGHPLCARPSHGACPALRKYAWPDFTLGLPTRGFTLAHYPGGQPSTRSCALL